MRRLLAAVGCVAVLVAGTPASADPPAPSIRDLARTVRLSDPRLSPDGRSVALVETRADLEHDEFHTAIVLVDIATRKLRPLTRGRDHAASPRWSPSGDRLAFLAQDGDKKLQLFILPMAGGEALQVTHVPGGIDQFVWSPDGTSLAFGATDPAPERKGEDKFRTEFSVGNDDFLTKEKPRPSHVWLVPAEGGAPKRLTSGTWSLPVSLPPGPPASPLQFTPDGKSIVLVRQETPSTGDEPLTRIQVLDVATGKLRDLTGATTLEGYPVVSPDGSAVAYWRNRDGKPWLFQDAMVAPLAGGAGRDVTLRLDKNLWGTWWMPDGKSLLVAGNDATTVGLWIQQIDGAARRLELGRVMPANGYWVDADVGRQGAIVFVGQSADDPYELYLLTNEASAPQRLTDENTWAAGLRLGRTETFLWVGPAAGRMLDGVVTYPPDFDAHQAWPLVLIIHGGPNSASRDRFNLFSQVAAAHGWIVFEPNYRGSDNMDNAFYGAIYQDAGQGPGEDVMAGVAALRQRGFVDAGRMAVSGWSYGGFMTTWLAGHYDVWRAAVAGAAVTDWVEMYDLSDGNVTVSSQAGGSPYVGDGLARYRSQSPDASVTRIRAPTLVMCDTGDYRVPITQSYGLFRALRDNHVETEFYAYPIGGHFPGDPIRQMDVYDRWIGWIAAHLH
jgi:dipeptidyl aminopeptidase/acylaminoacyl peptidase